MDKKISKGDLERLIYQTTIADLTNINKSINNNAVVDFKDVKISFELFKHFFYDNNYKHFDLNNQTKDLNEMLINSKIIKKNSFYKNYEGGTKINIVDILILKYIENKKTKLDDVTKISLIKDFNRYNSLLDFKIYNNHLGLDDILTLFNQYENKNNKKYFRFKIKVTYYSVDLDESISMYFNYLVKIPENISMYFNYLVKVPENIYNDETNDNENSVFEDSVEDDLLEPIKSTKETENIVYSNYIKKVKDENINLNELIENDDDDNASNHSNISVSSCENNNNSDHNLFF